MCRAINSGQIHAPVRQERHILCFQQGTMCIFSQRSKRADSSPRRFTTRWQGTSGGALCMA